MLRTLLDTVLSAPAVPNPPRRVRRDWVVVTIALIAVVAEGAFRPDLAWRGVGIALGGLIAFSLLWRRTNPLAMTTIAFVAILAADGAARIAVGRPIEMFSAAFVLIHPYALCRWGSGRHAAVGLGVTLATPFITVALDPSTLGDAIGGPLVLLFPAVVGLEVRQVVGSRARVVAEAKASERDLLARELHDTVAHHVSAIAIQAQAGRAVGVTRPAAAMEALDVIEREASRTLREMRSIVSSLRGTQAAEFAPQPGLDDIVRLSTPGGSGPSDPAVTVTMHEMVGDRRADEVAPSVAAALFRIAQESITNTRRHARNASLIDVRIGRVGDVIRLSVDDDGTPPASKQVGGDEPRFGIVGMTERAELLGGSLCAQRRADGGWRVEASIPSRVTS